MPRRLFAADADAVAALELDALPGDRVVVKAVAPGLVHKTEAGAVTIVDKNRAAIGSAVAAMTQRLGGDGRRPAFCSASSCRTSTALGGELLLSLRWSDAHGPLVTLAPGGVQAELLAERLDGGRAAAVLSPHLGLDAQERVMERKTLPRLLAREFRGRPAPLGSGGLRRLLENALRLAEELLPDPLTELEINPLALTEAGPVALDVLARAADEPRAGGAGAPAGQARQLLRPAPSP